MRFRVGVFLTLAWLVLAGCDVAGEDGDIVEGIDFDVLFAPPSADETQAVREDWGIRDVSAGEYGVVRSEVVTVGTWTGTLRVVRHRVDDAIHYGAIISPSSEPNRLRSVLVYLHGGDAGVSVADLLLAYELLPELRDEFVLVLPSFRSEPLFVDGQEYLSAGTASPWDRDVDDALALLNVSLEIEERADPDRIAAIGFSRGATVALLMAIRDSRIDGVVEFFGATDFFGTFVQEVVRDALRGDLRELPGLSDLNDRFIQPARRKETDLQTLRMELVRRSPVLFAAQLPAVQVHHGLIDPVVPPSEGESLVEVMQGLSAPDFEYYFYPNGSHHPLTMEGSIERASDFLLRVTNPPPA